VAPKVLPQFHFLDWFLLSGCAVVAAAVAAAVYCWIIPPLSFISSH